MPSHLTETPLYRVVPAPVWPCSHKIEERLRANEELTIRDTHEHWRLGKDLASGDLYLPILEPLAVVVRRGRPVIGPEQIPIAAIPRGDNYRRRAAASRQRDPSQWELMDQAEIQGHLYQGRDIEVSTPTPARGRGRGSGARGTTGRRGRGRGRGRGQQNRVYETQGGTGPASSAAIQLGAPEPDTPLAS